MWPLACTQDARNVPDPMRLGTPGRPRDAALARRAEHETALGLGHEALLHEVVLAANDGVGAAGRERHHRPVMGPLQSLPLPGNHGTVATRWSPWCRRRPWVAAARRMAAAIHGTAAAREIAATRGIAER